MCSATAPEAWQGQFIILCHESLCTPPSVFCALFLCQGGGQVSAWEDLISQPCDLCEGGCLPEVFCFSQFLQAGVRHRIKGELESRGSSGSLFLSLLLGGAWLERPPPPPLPVHLFVSCQMRDVLSLRVWLGQHWRWGGETAATLQGQHRGRVGHSSKPTGSGVAPAGRFSAAPDHTLMHPWPTKHRCLRVTYLSLP